MSSTDPAPFTPPPAAPGPEPASADPGHPSAPPTRGSRIRAYRTLWTLGLAVFGLDQLTKLWIVAHVPFDPLHSHGAGGDIEVIRGFFYIIHVGNTGAAWSMFSGRSITLAMLAVATLVAIYFWRHSLGLKHRLSQVCFGLLCGGIAGNLVDRLVHKHVIDFIDLHFGSYIYPTFNVADSGICVGVLLYLWQSLRAPDGARK
ncbi:MAG: signal peptidase II [Opitutaceae bacterium]|nr:signal peptidase II [Opitutaceae bacterium]